MQYARNVFFPLKKAYRSEIKASLFAGVMIVYIENLKECTSTRQKKNPRTKKWVKAHGRIQDSHKNNCVSIHQQDYFSDFPGSEDKETELWCLLMTALPLGKDLPTGCCSLTQKHKGKQTSEVRGGKGERDEKKSLQRHITWQPTLREDWPSE